jgi:hypothetical protein
VISLAVLILSLAGAFALLFGARDPRIEAFAIGAGGVLFAVTYGVAQRIATSPLGPAIWRESLMSMLGLGLLFAVLLLLIVGQHQRRIVIAAHRVAYGLSITFWTASALLLVTIAASM